MKIIVNSKSWDVDAVKLGGIIKNMHDDGYDQLNLSNINRLYITEDIFDAFIHLDKTHILSTKDLVHCFKIAHYLNAEINMINLGKEIANRLKISTKNGVKEILSYF